jgi:hypothetical protein
MLIEGEEELYRWKSLILTNYRVIIIIELLKKKVYFGNIMLI